VRKMGARHARATFFNHFLKGCMASGTSKLNWDRISFWSTTSQMIFHGSQVQHHPCTFCRRPGRAAPAGGASQSPQWGARYDPSIIYLFSSRNSDKQTSVRTHLQSLRGLRHSYGMRNTRTGRNYNPTTAKGREQIRKTIVRSGPTSSTYTPIQVPKQGRQKPQRLRLEGWRFGAFMSIVAVGVCLIVELIVLVCAMTLGKPRGVQDSIGVLL
jgi:hypothetical protein